MISNPAGASGSAASGGPKGFNRLGLFFEIPARPKMEISPTMQESYVRVGVQQWAGAQTGDSEAGEVQQPCTEADLPQVDERATGVSRVVQTT